MKSYIVIDCETGGISEAAQREIMPTEWPIGNVKQEDKVKAAIAEKEKSWLDSAALDPIRCEVLAIGLAGADFTEPKILHGDTEHVLLTHLRDWATVYSDLTWVGHNILGFDLPLLTRRMWRHGITPPKPWLDCTPWKAKSVFDTLYAWSCGNREQRISLDLLAWHFGLGRKNGTGAQFAKLYETDRESALAYLRKDLELTETIYLRMNK